MGEPGRREKLFNEIRAAIIERFPHSRPEYDGVLVRIPIEEDGRDRVWMVKIDLSPLGVT